MSFRFIHVTSSKCVAVRADHNLGKTSSVVLKRGLKGRFIVSILLLLLFLKVNVVLSIDKTEVFNVSLKVCIG